MKACILSPGQSSPAGGRHLPAVSAAVLATLLFVLPPLRAQDKTPDPSQPDLAQQVQALSETLSRTQNQLEQSQRELNELRNQLSALKLQLAAHPPSSSTTPPATAEATPATPSPSSSSTAAAIDDLRERQALQESQIATHEQSKVESDSKYPVKVTGLLLFNGFVNTRAVNLAATPTVATGGSGSTGATIRQTILGFDARGPHLFGAQSFADLRVDFAGTTSSSQTSGFAGPYSNSYALLRLRTAHAILDWRHTQAFFSLDRPLISPDTPASLAAVAEPALAWSGNLWTWNPQVGVTHDFDLSGQTGLRAQAALIDVADAPFTPLLNTSTVASTAEQSRWPGVESRIALFRANSNSTETDNHFGIGGYVSPHRLTPGHGYDAWAASLDANLHLAPHLEWTASAYRGLALGGLGGGVYKDIAYYADPDGHYYWRALDDVGGWTQLKERLSSRLEFNEAFGTDQIFAGELRPYFATGATYQNLAAARTWTGNFIYRPSAYLLFSLEYRRLQSVPVNGAAFDSNVFGLAAGYKF